jgi:predicted DNA-binding transcriptional regulator AlpA
MQKTIQSKYPILIRMPKVLSYCGFSKTYLYEASKNGNFPAPVRLSEESEVIDWVEARIQARNKSTKVGGELWGREQPVSQRDPKGSCMTQSPASAVSVSV